MKDVFGNLIVHSAVSHDAGASDILVSEILGIFPDSISAIDNRSNTILHTAMKSPYFTTSIKQEIRHKNLSVLPKKQSGRRT